MLDQLSPQKLLRRIELEVLPLEAAAFAPFGRVIAPKASGTLYDDDDEQLDIGRGIPRFYILSLKGRPSVFHVITRHLSVTQCLASAGGHPWLVAVAPPDDPDNADAMPDLDRIKAFRVPGNLGIKLNRSTWHAGPFFDGDGADFFNLELHDTNIHDHFSYDFGAARGLEMAFRP